MTPDDVVLPELPGYFEDYTDHTRQAAQDYARAAILADRERRQGAPVPRGWKFHVSVSDGRSWLEITTPGKARAVLSAQRKIESGGLTVAAQVLDYLADTLAGSIAALTAERAGEREAACPACGGNDGDAPCAYPGDGMRECLRDQRLAAPAQPTAEPVGRAVGKIRFQVNEHPYALLDTAYDENGNVWKDGTKLYAAPVQEQPAQPDGYADAFYQIAALMGIPAQDASPQHVFETQMLPGLRAVLQEQPARELTDEEILQFAKHAAERIPNSNYEGRVLHAVRMAIAGHVAGKLA